MTTTLPRCFLSLILACIAVQANITTCVAATLNLEVDRITGIVEMQNNNGADVLGFDFYQITSATASLSESGWTSIQQQTIVGFPPSDGSGNGWQEAGGASNSFLAEAYLIGASTFGDGMTISLGIAYNVGVDARDLVFTYLDDERQPVDGLVNYTIPEPSSIILLGLVNIVAIITRESL